LVKALLRRQSNATSEWSHTCCLLQLENPLSQAVTVTSFPLQSLTSRTKKSPSRFLSRVCFSERRKTGNQLTKSKANFTTFSRTLANNPSSGLQDMGHQQYPSTVKRLILNSLLKMKVFLYLSSRKGKFLN
jgi:hypothetical protein